MSTEKTALPTRVMPPLRLATKRVRISRLRVSSKDRPEESHQIVRSTLRVGSRPGNDLVLADDAVSRVHFEIVLDDQGFLLRDLGSTNGTFVDGYRAIELYLKERSRIVV